MFKSVYEMDYWFYSQVCKPESAEIYAGLMGLARRQDARLRAEGHPGLFETVRRVVAEREKTA